MPQDVVAVLRELLRDALAQVRHPCAQAGDVVEDGLDQVESIQIIQHGHVEGRGCRALLLVTADMQVCVPVPAIGQAMDQPRVAVEREYDRLGRQ